MLSPTFYERYNPLPQAPTWPLLASAMRAWMAGVGFRVEVIGAERLPEGPALLCTNSTQRHDFFALMRGLDALGKRVVTFTKAKNFHSPVSAFVMRRTGTIPLASRGYVISIDLRDSLGRRPTDEEYRTVRDHVDREAPLSAALRWLQTRPRDILGVPFDPQRCAYRDQVQEVYRRSLAETVRLAKVAVDDGCYLQIYPEGTVSRHLGAGRIGAVQFAKALGLAVVPIGMSGCPGAFFGESPVPAPGTVRIRVGEPLALAAALPAAHRAFHPDDEAANRAALLGATQTLMGSIEALVDDAHKRPRGGALPGKGVRAFL